MCVRYWIILMVFSTFSGALYAQSRLTYIIPKYNAAQIDSLESTIRNETDPKLKVQSYAALIYAYRKTTPVKALAVAEEALQFAKLYCSRTEEAVILTEYGKAYDANRDTKNAQVCFTAALQLYRFQQNTVFQGIILDFIGQSYFDSGNYPEALKYYLQSLAVLKNTNDLERISIVQNDIGIVNNFIGNYEVALTYYFAALKIKESIATDVSRSSTLANIADVYYNLKNYTTAEIYFQRAVKRAADPKAKLLIMNKISSVIAEMGRVEEAKQLLLEVQKDLHINESKPILAFTFMTLGKVFLKAEQLDSAYTMYNKAYCMYKSYGGKNGCVEALNQLGFILIQQKKQNQAFPLLDSAYFLADSLHLKDKLRETTEYLSLAYEKNGNYPLALKFRKLNNILKDSIDNGQKTAIIVSAQLQYETEMKNKEIDLLLRENEYSRMLRNFWLIISVLFVGLALLILTRYLQNKKNYFILEQKNEEIKAKNDLLQKATNELQESIATKDKFFSIISHDLRNPFNTILLISSIFTEEDESLTREETRKMGLTLYKTVNNAYKLLENLLEWSRIQRNKVEYTPALFSAKLLSQAVIESLEETARAKNITLHLLADNDYKIIADKNMVDLILRNLVTNAVKFSFAGSTVRINLLSDQQFFKIQVKDEGVGISAENQAVLFHIGSNTTTRGTDEEPGTGLGLILCKEMAELHHGTITVVSEVGKGSIFTLILPIV